MKAADYFHTLRIDAENNVVAIKEHTSTAISRHAHCLSDYDDYLPVFVLHNLRAGSLQVLHNGRIVFYL